MNINLSSSKKITTEFYRVNSMHFNYNLFFILFCITIFISLISCEQKSEYQQLVQRELEKDVRHDSLFLGYKFGMERLEFFDHSWQLNQEGIITGGSYVEYQLDNISPSATMAFFPEFHNGKIYKMPIEVQYDGWAPWNKDLFSDSLIVELVDNYEKIYGPGFIKTTHPENGKESWIKVDGNRRISIFKMDDMKAAVEFLDLSVDKES